MALFLLSFGAAGAVLALVAYAFHWPAGVIGAAAFIAWALHARQLWRRERDNRAPGAPERVVRICAAGTAMLLGHSVTLLAIPDLDLRTDHGHALVLDSWFLGGAWFLAWLFFLKEGRVRDERHAHIVAGALRAGYGAMHALLIPFCLYIAFAPPRIVPEPFVIANMLITVMLAAYLALLTAQMMVYARDRALADEESLL